MCYRIPKIRFGRRREDALWIERGEHRRRAPHTLKKLTPIDSVVFSHAVTSVFTGVRHDRSRSPPTQSVVMEFAQHPARGTPLGQMPLPDEPDFVVFGGADALEAEFVKDARRGIFRRKRLRGHSDSRYLGVSDIHQRLGHLSCEPLALVRGEGEIRDFDPVFARGTFKRAGADATFFVDDQVRDPGWVEAATP